jgi:hypothetical protein
MNNHSFNEQWRRDGYLVVRQLFDAAAVAELRAICDDVLCRWLNEAADAERAANSTNMAYLTEPRYFTEKPPCLSALLEAIAHRRILATLDELSDRELLFHNTQYFFNPASRSRAGDWHRDQQFGAPDEATEKSRMRRTIGLHLHLAFLPDDNLEIVPGSHARWDTREEWAIRHGIDGRKKNEAALPGAERILLEAGDGCFFSAWAIHRGSYLADRPRRTFDIIYGTPADWHTPPPTCFLAPSVLDNLSPPARHFFERFIAAYKDKWRTGQFDY